MLIELAHYTVLFALTVVGLQTFLLCPTLWSGGSAVAIRLGFRGLCFTTGLLAFSFVTLLSAFVFRDFSLAVVFETFDSQTSPFYALQAFCSGREGFFFTFVVLFSAVFLGVFSKKDLATYQERGRYLFAGGFLIFFLLTLMLATADPFVRIKEPPFEGVGFNPEWRPPYKILFTLFSFGATACLTVSFIKAVCMYSKGRQFVRSLLRADLLALFFLSCALGEELMTAFAKTDDGALWLWTPADSLLLALVLLSAGQAILMFFRLSAAVFTNWILCSSFLAACLSNAGFLATEYRLFAQSDAETYFPNPVVALSALAGMSCFLLFLNSVTFKTKTREDGFSLFSAESFAGLSFAALMGAAISVGTLSLLPTLFMFLPDLPLRLLPALIRMTVTGAVAAASVLLFIAFKRKSVNVERKSAAVFLTVVLISAALCVFGFKNGGQIVLYTLPSVFILGSVVRNLPFNIPQTPKEALRLLKATPAFRYGVLFCAAGFFVFSAALSFALFNQTRTETILKLSEKTKADVPCAAERLSEKSAASAAKYRVMCDAPFRLIDGDTVFQWGERESRARFLKTEYFSTRLLRIDQTGENDLSVRAFFYPALQLTGAGILLICSGIVFLLFSLRKENGA